MAEKKPPTDEEIESHEVLYLEVHPELIHLLEQGGCTTIGDVVRLAERGALTTIPRIGPVGEGAIEAGLRSMELWPRTT